MESNLVIKRDYYLNQLIEMKHKDFIKIITGIRRCGKSYLLFNLFYHHLKSTGVDDAHIIRIDLEDRRNVELRNPDVLLKHIDSQIKDDQMHYVLLDEVQLVSEFESVLNSYMHVPNADVYVTGSNSKFLSKDIITEFRGRGWDIHIYPLSFAEYYDALGGNPYERWQEYSIYGGLPQVATIEVPEKKKDFLRQVQKTVYIKDLIERHNIQNKEEFQELFWVISSGIGSLCNPTKLSNTFKSQKGVTLAPSTISNYLTYMEDAFLIERSMRYNIKGKHYINTLSKYYFQDVGIRNAAIGFRQIEHGHLMENMIYNELRRRKLQVDVGLVEVWSKDGDKRVRKQLEVDFVVEASPKRFYIQSAWDMSTAEKKVQESASLLNISDGFKRVIITLDASRGYYDNDGIFIVGLFEFLLNPDVLEQV